MAEVFNQERAFASVRLPQAGTVVTWSLSEFYHKSGAFLVQAEDVFIASNSRGVEFSRASNNLSETSHGSL